MKIINTKIITLIISMFLIAGCGGDGKNTEVFSITHNGTTYGVVTSPYTKEVWLDRNLGAARVCESFNDTACYGDYYQWGRNADGHQDSLSATTTTIATNVNNVNNVGNSSFIVGSFSGDWIFTDINGSIRSANWSKTDGTSVCPVGFRVPTLTELKAETLDNGVIDNTTAFSNFLKLPSSGLRQGSDGSLLEQGTWGYVWTSSITSYSPWMVYFNDGLVFTSSSNTSSSNHANGLSVRCIKN